MKLRRIGFLFIAAIMAASFSLAASAAIPPNVLMIPVDALSDYISILQNHPGIKTPNFDRLAKRGINFTRAYTAAPVCQPSRAAVASGIAPHRSGIYDLPDLMTDSQPLDSARALAEQFNLHGYDTYMTGKYYHGGKESWWSEYRIRDGSKPCGRSGAGDGNPGGYKQPETQQADQGSPSVDCQCQGVVRFNGSSRTGLKGER